MLEENKVFIIIKPLDPAIALDHPVNNSDGVVRARVIRGGFLIEPLSENQCRFYLIFNFDAYLAVLPIWLLNWFTGKLVHYIVVRLRRAVHFDDKSEYPARIKRDPDFYNYVEEIVRQHNSKDRQV